MTSRPDICRSSDFALPRARQYRRSLLTIVRVAILKGGLEIGFLRTSGVESRSTGIPWTCLKCHHSAFLGQLFRGDIIALPASCTTTEQDHNALTAARKIKLRYPWSIIDRSYASTTPSRRAGLTSPSSRDRPRTYFVRAIWP